ncbi:MAG: NADP-dependent phosphogluconate dehydrogenase [Deltaproteobacteria bacterium]|jgi:6-phosphogluconate dehydrogenase|nr:NADP-dependent phosphogluconate dehydrogenase [Deltaproteobacteria bacterium]MBW2530231.1 NADP-dependent phosphogluconate dehydrogenase [Deltaproteobacteria bacterium]
MASPSEVGVIGLGVMGRALAANFAERGARVVGFDRVASRSRAAAGTDPPIEVVSTIAELVDALLPPRVVILMVPAGPVVDEVVRDLEGALDQDDTIVDGGNSHYRDTARRGRAEEDRGVHYLGVGVSGGEAGARHGPCIMAGGTKEAWRRAEPLLRLAAARLPSGACAAWVGPDGAGHFVKMVHNGIEYADMQLVSEACLLLRQLGGLGDETIATQLAAWNEGVSGSYLLEITVDILRMIDRHTSRPILDVVLDVTGHKGTGRWAAAEALELGVPAPTLLEAVMARAVSTRRSAREELGPRRIAEAEPPVPASAPRDWAESALLAGRLAALAQGFELLRGGSEAHRFDLPVAEIARIWQGGCIIRSKALELVERACAGELDDRGLLGRDDFARELSRRLPALRWAVAEASRAGIPIPCLASGLTWWDGMHTSRSTAALVQAQRDYFGAHGLERTDRAGRFHLDGSEA